MYSSQGPPRWPTTITQDDFFEHPFVFHTLSQALLYWDRENHPEDIGAFPGVRTKSLHNVSNDIWRQVMHLLEPSYNKFGVTYKDGYHNYSFSKLKKDFIQDMHSDDDDRVASHEMILAGVIYLNPTPINPLETGTWFTIDNQIKKIENKYNRLVLYDGATMHSAGAAWGDSWEDCRLTLTIAATFPLRF